MVIVSSRENSARAAARRFSPRRSALVALAAVGMVGLSLLAAGCGSSPSAGGVAQVTTNKTGTNSASPSGSGKGDPAAYSVCIRKHGVPNFPDPDSQGRIHFGVQNGQTGVDTAQFAKAQNACKSLQPNGGAPSPQAQAKAVKQMLQFGQCMRSHGVPKFPDPKVSSGGGAGITLSKNSGVDPNSPQFKAAQQACQTLVPGSPPPGSPGGSSAGAGGKP
jgi:hypothetical protein